MNELLYSFLNEIEDVNKLKEMTIEEFTKLVKSNKLISDDDAKLLIESFKKISDKKSSEDESSDTDQRKKKYRSQQKNTNSVQNIQPSKKSETKVKENDGDSLER